MAYIDKYGVEFSDDRTILVQVPTDYAGIYEIPNGTISVGYEAFKGCSSITTIVIPATIEDAFDQDEDYDFLASCKNLAYFIVDSQNKYYYAVDGVLYLNGKDEKFVVAYPPAKHDDFYLPNDVKLCYSNYGFCKYSMWGLALHCTPGILEHLKIDETNPNYILKDGALYNKELEYLIKVSCDEKQYIMPDSIVEINAFAFKDCSKLKKIVLGCSFTSWDSELDITDVFQDCSSLERIDVRVDNEEFYSIDGVLYERCSCYTGYAWIKCVPRAMRKKVYEIDGDVANQAFASCKNIQNFKINYSSIIGRDAFINTAFYNNSENWDDDILYLGRYLIKVSEEYNRSKLVIPPTTHVIVVNSITNSNITTLDISEGVCHFNSRSIRCPNLKTIKLPSSLFSSYLSKYQIEFKSGFANRAPKLEKILIPKGMRDFYLPHIDSCYHKLLFEYDDTGNEFYIQKLTSDEEKFYKSIHEYSGFPNYKQYTTIKRALLNEEAMSEMQILSLLPNIDKFELRFWDTCIQSCLEKEGYVVKHVWYNPSGENKRISLFYLELDNKIKELEKILTEKQELRTQDFRNIFGVGWDNEWTKYNRLRNFYFKCTDR